MRVRDAGENKPLRGTKILLNDHWAETLEEFLDLEVEEAEE